jgi:hypothetical protein
LKRRGEQLKDLFWPALEQIIDMGHPLMRLAGSSTGHFQKPPASDVAP